MRSKAEVSDLQIQNSRYLRIIIIRTNDSGVLKILFSA